MTRYLSKIATGNYEYLGYFINRTPGVHTAGDPETWRVEKSGRVIAYHRTLKAAVKFVGGQKVIRTNLMSSKPFETTLDAPASCDPSSETYWSS